MSAFLPKSIVCFREGYSLPAFARDLFAGVTVGIIALPLAMAFGIASIPESALQAPGPTGAPLSPPAMGLYTAIIAGFLISALGGSRVQIGGPTGAFIVIVYGVTARHGYDGLATATFLAGAIVVVLGVARFGGMIKFIPYPVTTGFTAGIAVIIFSSQVKDLLGLDMGPVPADLVEKWGAYADRIGTWSGPALGISLGTLAILILQRRFAPRLPGALVAVIAASLAAWLLDLPVPTIESRFGAIPRTLPAPHLPSLSWDLAIALIPDAGTIALLVAIESLLSAVVADGMMGGRHKADCELVAQGVANMASVAFGGIPATGAIARTAANVKTGGRTPVAGMVHAAVLLLIMALLGPLAGRIPLAALAGILVMVAWNMSEIDKFRSLLRAPRSDVVVLLVTFLLTVFSDLTIAVGVGMVLASFLFMRRMVEIADISAIRAELDDGPFDDAAEIRRTRQLDVPPGVEVYKINGPFFFGVADRLKDILRRVEPPPRVFILRLRAVPAMDATGLHALEELHHKCRRDGTRLLLASVQPQPRAVLERSGFLAAIGEDSILDDVEAALRKARELMAG